MEDGKMKTRDGETESERDRDRDGGVRKEKRIALRIWTITAWLPGNWTSRMPQNLYIFFFIYISIHFP